MDLVAMHRSSGRPACEERAFVLHAVGIESQLSWLGRAWALMVPGAQRDAALAQLA